MLTSPTKSSYNGVFPIVGQLEFTNFMWIEIFKII